MQIVLSVWERITIEKFYPVKANLIEATALKDLRGKMDFSQDEIIALEMRTEDSMVKWNKEKEFDRNIELTELEVKLLEDGLTRLDKSKEIETSVRFLDLCEKIEAL